MNQEEQDKNIKFVLEVQKYECLYNRSLSSYSRKTDTKKAWKEVAKAMQMTEAECKKKWRNLVSVLLRHIKSKVIGGAQKKMKPYYLLDVMEFVTPHLKYGIPGTSTSNVSVSGDASSEIDDDDNDNLLNNLSDARDDNFEEVTVASAFKRKKPTEEPKIFLEDYDYLNTNTAHEIQSANDPVTSFLNSLAPELREMNGQQFKKFKRRVLALIDDITTTNTDPVEMKFNTYQSD